MMGVDTMTSCFYGDLYAPTETIMHPETTITENLMRPQRPNAYREDAPHRQTKNALTETMLPTFQRIPNICVNVVISKIHALSSLYYHL